MSNVSLTSAVRQNLLSLQSTTDLISRTQNRLSTGLKVAGPIDDPVAFFQAKGIQDRSTDFTEKKANIDQGISSLTAATDAISAVESLVQQLKGLAVNAKSSTTTAEISNIVSQFNDLRTQVNNLTTDATYQGLNLVSGTGSTLTVNFSNDSASVLNVNSVDIRVGSDGLSVAQLTAATQTINFNVAAVSAGTLAGVGIGTGASTLTAVTGTVGAASIDVTVAGQTASTISAGDTVTLSYGGQSFTVNVVSAGGLTDYGALSASFISAGTYSIGDTVSFVVVSGGISAQSKGSGFSKTSVGGTNSPGLFYSTLYSQFTDTSAVLAGAAGTGGVLKITAGTGQSISLTDTDAKRAVGVGYTTALNDRITNLDSALTTLRSRAQTLGSNVALLQTRLDFTKQYVNTLTAGAGKLTLADLNQEGANLLALQTRQQLGIQSLAFAGQSEQAILRLFR